MIESVIKKVKVTAMYIPASWFAKIPLSSFERAVADVVADGEGSVALYDEKGLPHAFSMRDELLTTPYGGGSKGFFEVVLCDRQSETRHIVSLQPLMGF